MCLIPSAIRWIVSIQYFARDLGLFLRRRRNIDDKDEIVRNKEEKRER
jgi:hypothetical protein